jgi:nucleoside-diphosphate-sugar epimerase
MHAAADPTTPRTAFVTGGTGFVGSHLVEEVRRRGYAVRALVRKDPKWLDGLDVETVTGDLFDLDALRQGMEGATAVFHVAGLTRAPDYAALERANVTGTLNVLEVAAEQPGPPRVLVTSSLAAVGPSDRLPDGSGKPHTETALLRPISDYGKSKAEMERAIEKWQRGRETPLPLVIVRPPAVYGPREADIFTLFQTASKGLFPIVGDGHKPQLSLVHVRDLVRGMADALESDTAMGQTYFLSSARGYSWDEIREAALRGLGKKALRINVPKALVGTVGAVSEVVGRLTGRYPPLNREKAREAKEAWVCSTEKAKRDFGYAQQVRLEDGMGETMAWYREHGWL